MGTGATITQATWGSIFNTYMGTGATLTQATRGPSLTHIWGQRQPSHRQPGGPSLYTCTRTMGDRGNPHTGNQGVHPYTCIWGQGQPSHRQPGGHPDHIYGDRGNPYFIGGTGATPSKATRGCLQTAKVFNLSYVHLHQSSEITSY
jgi:hypothetical protein